MTVPGRLPLRSLGMSLAGSVTLAGVMALLLQGPEHMASALAIGAALPLCWLPLVRQGAETVPAGPLTEEPRMIDATTGLAGRAAFLAEAQDAFDAARRDGTAIAAVMIDVDHLSEINDEHGTEAGDAVLAHMARLIEMNIQPGVDLAGRYAGAGLMLLLKEADEAWTTAFCERLRGILANRPVPFNGALIPMSASVGIAVIAAGDRDAEALVRRSRAALVAAKAQGRNKVEVSGCPTPEKVAA
jgi:diguanylate cyclase (GGDEF)-like protein